MRVGMHEAIHGVGLVPSTMNSGAQAVPTLFGVVHVTRFGAVNSLCNS